MTTMMQQRSTKASSAHSRGASRRVTVVRAQAVQGGAQTEFGQAVAAAPKNQLEALRRMSTVVADTGDVALIRKYKPQDATTNPSLVLKAVQAKEYEFLLKDAIKNKSGKAPADAKRPWAEVADELTVNLGLDILGIVPGRVSTEVDAHLSFNTQATYDKALRLMDLYVKKGVDPKRVYIKIASTWQGIEACRRLQKQGIDTNMTLLFSFAQAAACADAGAALISPFVGRIMDWYKAKEGRDFTPEEDPGVHSVRRIYSHYKTHGYKTIVMAASFRNVGEIRELAGCDNITISPQLLGELEASTASLPRKLDPAVRDSTSRLVMNSTTFDAMHNADQMAVDKLAQGIEGFAVDQRKLEDLLAKAAAEL